MRVRCGRPWSFVQDLRHDKIRGWWWWWWCNICPIPSKSYHFTSRMANNVRAHLEFCKWSDAWSILSFSTFIVDQVPCLFRSSEILHTLHVPNQRSCSLLNCRLHYSLSRTSVGRTLATVLFFLFWRCARRQYCVAVSSRTTEWRQHDWQVDIGWSASALDF